MDRTWNIGTNPFSVGSAPAGSPKLDVPLRSNAEFPTFDERYRRIRKLGQGGMGVVHEVEERATGRRVALKTIRTDDPELLYRLKREFRNLARIRHPNLVRLHELASDDTIWFFTMELIDGTDFLSHCRAARSSRRRHHSLREGLRKLTEGLLALHAAGFVHRDIKPSNVLVEHGGRVVIVDFGLTSPLFDGQSGTLSADAAGTAAYIAPELLQSGLAGAHPGADWYALGVLLFEALCGRRPFHGSDFEVMQQKVSTEAPAVASVAPDAPADLARLCDELLKRDPERRTKAALEAFSRIELPGEPEAGTNSGVTVDAGLAGRDAELSILREELELTSAGACRVVLVRGESGIGKSTLARTFIQNTSDRTSGLVALSGRCYQRELVPFRALDGVVDQLSSHWKRLPRAEAMFLVPREAEYLLRLFPVLGRVPALTERAYSPTRTLSPPDALRRSMVAFKETLHRLARSGPLILWLDDVQWIDHDSVRLLEFLTDSMDPLRVLVILTSRPCEGGETASKLLESLLRTARTVELRGLVDEAMQGLVARALGAEDRATHQFIVREAAGSPFFALSLARRIAASGAPESMTLSGLLLRDLAALPPTARSLLELAAIAGKPLHPRVAARALGIEQALAEEELPALEALNLTQTCAGTFVHHFEAYHDRIRELVERQLEASRRTALHAALARALDQESRPDHEACARHYREAELLREAARHALCAAERAVEEFGFGRAAGYYHLCLELPTLTHEERARIQRKLADALKNCGRGREAAEQYLKAAAYADASGRIDCEQRAAEEFLRAGHAELGMETLRAILEHVGLQYPKSAFRALLASVARHAMTRAFALPEAATSARDVDAELLRRIDVCSGVAHCVGFLDPLMTSYYQSLHLQMALKAREPSRLCRALAAEAIYTSLGGKASRHGQALLRATRALMSRADDRARGVATYSEGVVNFMRGEWSAARELCERGERILKDSCTGVQWELDTTMLYVLASACCLGDMGAARARAQRHLEEVESRADLYGLTILRAGSAHLLRLADDQPHLVESDVASVMAAWPKSPFSIPRYWELSALTNSDLYLGDAARALARFNDWDTTIAGSLPMRVQVTRIRTLHARARAALAVASDSNDPKLVSMVLADANTIEGEGAAWALGLSSALRAGVATIQGERDRSRALLELGEHQFQNAEMLLDAAVLADWRAELAGGTEGAELARQTRQWMADRGVRNPTAFGRAVAPGRRVIG